MKGKNCVAIAMDRRLGAQYETVSTNFKRVFKMTDRCLVGCSGLATDMFSFTNYLHFRLNLYKLKENRDMAPKTLAKFISTSLYGRRTSPYLLEPILAGLDKDNQPYIAACDSIGCLSDLDSFFCIGTADQLLTGACETFYKADAPADELFEIAAQCIMAGIDRDAYSGWGAVVFLVTPEGITAKTLHSRMD
jgi:20S proteasome subunit beta 3